MSRVSSSSWTVSSSIGPTGEVLWSCWTDCLSYGLMNEVSLSSSIESSSIGPRSEILSSSCTDNSSSGLRSGVSSSFWTERWLAKFCQVFRPIVHNRAYEQSFVESLDRLFIYQSDEQSFVEYLDR